MNEVVPSPIPPSPEPPSPERVQLTTVTHVMYCLHVATWFSLGIFSVIAMIINYVKRPDLPDDFFRSHFRWQSRSFWFFLIGLWYLYRFVRGWWSFAEGRAMPVPPT